MYKGNTKNFNIITPDWRFLLLYPSQAYQRTRVFTKDVQQDEKTSDITTYLQCAKTSTTDPDPREKTMSPIQRASSVYSPAVCTFHDVTYMYITTRSLCASCNSLPTEEDFSGM